MPAIEFHDNRMILVKIGLYSVASVAGDEGSIQPLVGVQQHWGHARCVSAIEDLFVYLGHTLPRVNLANVGEARQPRAAGIDWSQAGKNCTAGRWLTDSSTSQIDGRLHAREAQCMQCSVPFQPWDDMRDNDEVRQSGIEACLTGVTAHLNHLAAGKIGRASCRERV